MQGHSIVIVAVLVAVALLLLFLQFYRMATGKDSGCSCCKRCDSGDKNRPDETTASPEPDSEENQL